MFCCFRCPLQFLKLKIQVRFGRRHFVSYSATRRNQICESLVKQYLLLQAWLKTFLSFKMFFPESGSMCDDSQSFILIYRKTWLCEDQAVKRSFIFRR